MSIGKAPRKWIYFGTAGGSRPLAAIVSHEWAEYDRAKTKERARVDRDAIIERDGMVCGICEGDIPDATGIDIDHIIPLSRGGTSDPDNLQVAHRRCNLQKAAS
jgi:5-methylcytosine-specific restriction endonuclease McrA